MRLVEQIFSGWLECRVGLTIDGAVLEPFDQSTESKQAFRTIAADVVKHDGEGYSIASVGSAQPDGPADLIWIVCDDAELARQEEGIDKVVEQVLTLDLSKAGRIYRRKKRPARRRRQQIVKFIGREGDLERFLLKQPIPVTGCNWPNQPSLAQAAAVESFFGEPPETSLQAHTMLSAYEYACQVSKGFPFKAHRRSILTAGIASFILAERSLRDRVRWRSEDLWKEGRNIAVGIASHPPYKHAVKFAHRLIDEMRGAGSEAFG